MVDLLDRKYFVENRIGLFGIKILQNLGLLKTRTNGTLRKIDLIPNNVSKKSSTLLIEYIQEVVVVCVFYANILSNEYKRFDLVTQYFISAWSG